MEREKQRCFSVLEWKYRFCGNMREARETETIEVMVYGHKDWNRTAEFAENCSWRAGKLLARKMRENDFALNERVIAAVSDGCIAGFCTLANKDELPEKYEFTPFAGFVFVDERFRGRRLSERMIGAVCEVAREQGFSALYIMSGEIGLYEKYCFTKIGEYETIYGAVDQLFYKTL